MSFIPYQWSDPDKVILAGLWKAGASVDDISSVLKRSTQSIKAARKRFGLPPRRQGTTKIRDMDGDSLDGDPIRKLGEAMSPENSRQADAWAGVRFDDDPRAPARERAHRGLPQLGRSMVGCAAMMAASQG